MVAPSGIPTIISSRGSHSFHEFTGQLDAFIHSVKLGAAVERKLDLYNNNLKICKKYETCTLHTAATYLVEEVLLKALILEVHLNRHLIPW